MEVEKRSPDSVVTVFNKQKNALETLDIITGEVVAVDGFGVEEIGFLPSDASFDAISNMVREGYTLKKIASMEGFPPLALMYRWKRSYPLFGKKIREAREDRADFLMEEAETGLREADEDTDIRLAKFKFDGLTSLAEKYNTKDYGNQKKGEAGASGPTQIIINTGIIRDADVVEVRTKELEDGQSES